MRPFGCPITSLNTLDHLGKFDGKADEGFVVGYSINSKAFRVYNSRTKKVEENLHVNFLENKPDIVGSGQEGKKKVSDQEYILLLVLNTSLDVSSSNEEVESSPKDHAGKKSIKEPTCVKGGKIDDLGCLDQKGKSIDDFENSNSTNNFNTASLTLNTASDKDGTFQRTYGEWNFSTPIPVNVIGSSFSHPAA
nr:retrovirus-related Pol polyprotein from transposon TNT 1-94 [Tanacetum cinerariifolium]